MTLNRSQRLIEVYNSVAGAAFFQRLLEEWRKGGARIVSHQAISETDYRARRGPLGRISLRWRMYAGYAWVCWRGVRAHRRHQPLRVVTTNPFFAPALVRRAGGASGFTINLLYDLFPDALIEADVIHPGSWFARRCAAITVFALRECEATVFLGDRLRTHTEATYGPARRAVVIPVGADGAPFRDSPPQLLEAGIAPQIIYSGQMGSMHDTKTIASILGKEQITAVRWAFFASGNGYARLRALAGSAAGVEWGAALPEMEWQSAMKKSHVAIVTIAAGAERVVMPSKTYSALVAGQAVLAVCRRNSDLADLIIRHDCGWVVEPGDVPQLKRVLAVIATDPVGLWAKRKNAFEAGHRYYDMTPISLLWEKLFCELEGSSSQPAVSPAAPRAA